jgi:hypothetical protein
MAEYLPIYKPGQALTLKASATITGGQLVALTGSGTVGPASAGSAAWVGVAAFDAATNDNVTIHSGGVQSVTASGAVTAGDAVAAAANGQVSTSATPASAVFVGVALTTAASGAKVRVKFAR